MIKHFVDILKEHKIDISKEYSTLYSLIYDKQVAFGKYKSFYDEISEEFLYVSFRGTAISLEDFEEKHNIYFSESPNDFSLDYFILFCEYWYNMSKQFYWNCNYMFSNTSPSFIIGQIDTIIEELNFKQINKDNFVLFVPKDNAAIEVSEVVSENSFETLFYNHYSLKGDLNSKRELLIKFASYLEPRRRKLNSINSKLESDLFQLFNKLHIRHNNKNINDPGHYVEFVADMNNEELEKWYDEVYQMYLLAILELEHLERKKELNVLINNINNKFEKVK